MGQKQLRFKPKHPKLRTDLPLMGDKEVMSWVDNIIKNTHKIDVEILAEYVNRAIDEDRLALTFERITKMCDKCDITYPEHTNMCVRCHSTKLRSFKTHDNLDEILAPKK